MTRAIESVLDGGRAPSPEFIARVVKRWGGYCTLAEARR